MKFIMIVKASKESEAGVMPTKELLNQMGKYNEELMKAGVLVDLTGLHPTSKGKRIQFSEGKRTVIDGPFSETKELVGGFWIIRTKSWEEAMEWALRAPAPHPSGNGQIEIRQFFELEDFIPSEALDRAKEFDKKLHP